MATHVVIEKATVRQTADGLGELSTELPAGTQVRIVETAEGWALVARDGKRLGYIEAKKLATLQ
jgi:hypothetical protein